MLRMKKEEWKLFGKLNFEKLFTRCGLRNRFLKKQDKEMRDGTLHKGGNAKGGHARSSSMRI